MTLEEAEELADAGRYAEAWRAVNNLSKEEMFTARALQVHVRCCPPLGRWEDGLQIAGVLSQGTLIDRMMAAGFYHCLAVAHFQDRDLWLARDAVATAIRAWLGVRITMLEDNRLAGLF